MNEHSICLHIPSSHPAYVGHFPGRPILPGALLLDMVLLALPGSVYHHAKFVKFLSPVQPSENLTLRYTETYSDNFRFVVYCDERIVASGEVVSGDAMEL